MIVLFAGGLMVSRDGNAFVRAWNATCNKPSGEDITDLVNNAVLSKGL